MPRSHMDRRAFLRLTVGTFAGVVLPFNQLKQYGLTQVLNTVRTYTQAHEPFDIYMTFDDGPFSDPDMKSGPTDNALQILQDHQAKATFFLHGRHILKWHGPVLARYINDGHAVGNHLWSQGGNLVQLHPSMVRLAYQYLLTETRIRDLMKSADMDAYNKYMQQPKLFRRPGGKNSLNEFLDLKNLRTIEYASIIRSLKDQVKWLEGVYDYSGWHVNGGESIPFNIRPLTPDTEREFILHGRNGYHGVVDYLQVGKPPHYSVQAKEGLIILFHDYDKDTRSMLPQLINDLRDLGAQFKSLPRPMDKPNSTTVGISYPPKDDGAITEF